MRSCFLSLIAALASVVALPAQTIQLSEGSLLLASVEDANGDGLRVRRLDNGGVLELRWNQLSAASALQIKRKFDLAGEVQDEVLARADEVDYLVKGQKQSVLGKIVRQNTTEVVVRKRGVDYSIPRAEIVGGRTLDVPVAQIYTKDEWYALRLAELKDPSLADQHVLMVEDLIKVRDYQHAGEHLQKATELKANSRDPDKIDTLKAKLDRYKEAAKERELLDQIQACRSRGTLVEFENGVKLIAEFESTFSNSRLKAEFDVEKTRFTAARQRFYAQKLAEYYRRSIGVLAEKKVSEPGISLQAARDYAENQMTDDLMERCAQQFRIEVDEARTLWADRANYPVGKRTEHFSYSVGSWVLGEEAIMKDTNAQKQKDQQKGAQPAQNGNTRQIQKIAQAMKQALERRRAAGQGNQGAAEQTEDDWWADANRAERAGWLRAYYAESGGQLVVTFATVSPCIACYGQGTVPEVNSEGKLVRTPCYLCHDTKYMRSFKAY
ncbi:MAG: hypothetical protein KDC98_03520 [Planctomycetes bacterium]|nr:hypothetical protein [Planctomycetota bacterium]